VAREPGKAKTMKLVMLRHGARSPHDFGDSSLNADGRAQAEALKSAIAPQGPLPQPTVLVASPKRRAKETLTPLANALQIGLTIDQRLDERHQNENMKEFEKRVLTLLDGLTNQLAKSSGARETCVFLCSHLDWLELALALLPTDLRSTDVNWTNCEYRVFRWQDGIWCLSASGALKAGG
jgi:broad specificity phosphatase PhoE